MANDTPAAPAAHDAARTPAEPVLGYLIDEDAYTRLMRCAVIADLVSGVFGECMGPNGKPMLLSAGQIAALGEYLQSDLRAALESCQWNRWRPEGRARTA